MGRLTDVVVGAAVLAGTFYAGCKYIEYQKNYSSYERGETTVMDYVDDALCSKYKYHIDNCLTSNDFESEEARYDFADYIGGTYSQSTQQELVELLFVELNPATQKKTIRDLKVIQENL